MYSDVGFIPLYWQVDPVFVAKGVTGINDNDTTNLFEWNKQ